MRSAASFCCCNYLWTYVVAEGDRSVATIYAAFTREWEMEVQSTANRSLKYSRTDNSTVAGGDSFSREWYDHKPLLISNSIRFTCPQNLLSRPGACHI